MFPKTFAMESPSFFSKDRGIKNFLCKNIDVLLNYQEVGIYMKYNTLHPLSKLVKMWEKVNAFKRFCDGERNFFSNKGGL